MALLFGSHIIDIRQVFYESSLSRAIVNLKPITPGHVLVIPKRVVSRVSQLSTEEMTDLFLSVHQISKGIEEFYCADAMNIAIQDGEAAGQSVPHVHVHILPRRKGDFQRNDQVYDELDNQNLDKAYQTNFSDNRLPRSISAMEEEALKLRELFPNNQTYISST